jgi:hypothetical protein
LASTKGGSEGSIGPGEESHRKESNENRTCEGDSEKGGQEGREKGSATGCNGSRNVKIKIRLPGVDMKANKALRRLTKIESLMSDVTQRYSANALVREVLQDAKVAVQRAKDAVGSHQASSGTPKNAPVKNPKPSSKQTPEPSKPKRKLSAVGRKAIAAATKKRWALKREEAAESKTGASTDAAVKGKGVAKAAKSETKNPIPAPAKAVTEGAS